MLSNGILTKCHMFYTNKCNESKTVKIKANKKVNNLR